MGGCYSSEEKTKEDLPGTPPQHADEKATLSGTATPSADQTQLRESTQPGTTAPLQEERMGAASTSWELPKLTIFTEMSASEEEAKLAGGSTVDGGKYAATPVVPVTPFVARDTRMLAVSIFQERFGKQENTGEAEKTGDLTQTEGTVADETKEKEKDEEQSCTQLTPTAENTMVAALPVLEPKELLTQSLDAMVLKSPLGGIMDETMRFQLEGDVQEEKVESAEKQNGYGSVGHEEVMPSVGELSETPKTGKRNFFIFRRSQKEPATSEKRKEKGKEKEKEKKTPKTNIEEKSVDLAEKPPSPTREQVIQVGWQRLQQHLDDLKLVEHRVKDDGNCQFRAIAQQLFGSEEYHELVRAHIVTYMRSVRECFDCYFPSKEEADVYYRDLLRQGTWGDELTLRAASDSLFINIHVLSSEQQNCYITYRPGTDAPPPPAFLIDVATLRQQQQQQQQQRSDPASLTYHREGTADEVVKGLFSGCRTPNQLPVAPVMESEAPRQNPKLVEKAEVEEESVLDACALQRCLQRKLAASTIHTAATPLLDRAAGCSHFASSSGSDLRLTYDNLGPTTPGDPPCRKTTAGMGINGGIDMSFEIASVPVSSVNNSTQDINLFSASRDVAKFYAMGAEKMDNTKQQQLIVLIPSSTIVTSAEGNSTQQTFEPLGSVSGASFLPRTLDTRGVVVVPHGPRTNGGVASPVPSSGCENAMSCTHSPVPSLDSDVRNVDGSIGIYSTLEDEPKICVTFEAHSEPIDVFLSYLSPVHYNALSLSECHLTSHTEPHPNESSGRVLPPSLSFCVPGFETPVTLSRDVSANVLCQRSV